MDIEYIRSFKPGFAATEYQQISCNLEYFEWDGSANSNISGYHVIKKRVRNIGEVKIIFVLPVLLNNEDQFGNGIELIEQMLCNDEINDNVVFVQPIFNTTPWYANHPLDDNIQQESNTIELIDIINTRYNGYDKKNYLLGFSKSGWGSMNLILNHPSKIDGVLIWDAPLGLDTFITGDMQPVFQFQGYLQSTYDLKNNLVVNNANLIGKEIHISGYSIWQTLSDDFVNLLPNYPQITYTEDDTQVYGHLWNSLWIKNLLSNLDDVVAN